MRSIASTYTPSPAHWLATAALVLLCGGLTASGAASDPPRTTTVSVTVQAPAGLATIAGRRLDARLYRFDPRLADVAATLIDRAELPFTHRTGETTTTAVTLGGDTLPDPGMGYYVTVFVLADDERTHIGERNGEPGLMRVLTDGHPNEIHVILRPVR